MDSFNPQRIYETGNIVVPIFRWKNSNSYRLYNLFQVIQLYVVLSRFKLLLSNSRAPTKWETMDVMD